MITLNLIAPEKRQELRLTLFYVFIKNVSLTLLTGLVGVAIVLLLAKLTLQNYFTSLIEQTSLTARQRQVFSGDITSFNRLVSDVEKISADYASLSATIHQLLPLLPPGITLDHLIVRPDFIELQGLAATRADLLKLEEQLAGSPLITGVTIPLEQKIKKTEIEFSAKAKLNSSTTNHATGR